MKCKPETSYGQIIRHPKGVSCLTMLILALLLLSVVFANHAQGIITIDPIPNVPVPPGHSFDCQSNPDALYYVGPNCVNPVTWDIQGMRKLGTWAFFKDANGVTDSGLVVGFVWNWQTQIYDYLLLTRQHDATIGYAGQYKIIADVRITYP